MKGKKYLWQSILLAIVAFFFASCDGKQPVAYEDGKEYQLSIIHIKIHNKMIFLPYGDEIYLTG